MSLDAPNHWPAETTDKPIKRRYINYLHQQAKDGTASDKHLACGMQWEQCATAWQKAMGEALFGKVLAELRKSGIRRAPSSDP
jgi:hypothetical protein